VDDIIQLMIFTWFPTDPMIHIDNNNN